MARYGIDAATLLHLVDADLTVDPAHQLVAPKAILSEALALLLADVRAGRRTEKEARAIHTTITEAKLRMLGDRVSRGTAWKVAQEHGFDDLRDAEHVAVTLLQADALVTVDQRLAGLAQGIVPLAPVAALLSHS